MNGNGSGLTVLMRIPSERVADGIDNFGGPPEFKGQRACATEMAAQVKEVAKALRKNGATVYLDSHPDGQRHPDGTFTFDHASFYMIGSKRLALLPTLNWVRAREMPLNARFIRCHSDARIQLSNCNGSGEYRLDNGTILSTPFGALIGYSPHEEARTNKAAAEKVRQSLTANGYNKPIVLAEYQGLHLSTYCTLVASRSGKLALLACGEYLEMAAIRQFASLIGATIIEVGEHECWRANCISHPLMGEVLLMHPYATNGGKDELREQLERLGHPVRIMELTESPKVQGSLACHTLMV